MKTKNKKNISCCRVVLAALFLSGMLLPAAAQNSLDLGARYHVEHRKFDELPFGNGDISYLLAYSYANNLALWQLGVGFAPDVSGKMVKSEDDIIGNIDYVITPQLNFIFKDRFFRGGTGIRTSYIKSDDDDQSEWMDLYWQLLLGINAPLADRFSLDIAAVYVYERWDYLDRFDFRDLEYTLSVSFSF